MTRPASFASFRFKVPAPRLVPALSTLGLGVALALSTAACSSSSGGNTGGSPATGGTSATGGSTSTGGATSTGGTSGTGGSGQGGNATGGQTSTGGTPATGGSGGSATGGKGGSSSTGGSSTGGSGGGSTGGSSGGGSSGNGQCPTNATFCSGFEEAALPSAVKLVDYNAVAVPKIDATQHNSGSQSVQIPVGSGGGEMFLEVPASQAFWFRAYLRTDVAVGGTNAKHESFMGAFVAGADKGVEIVQEQCQVAININDNPVLGSNGMNPPINCPADGKKLEANKWYCFEGHFDGASGNLEVFVDNDSIIKASAVAGATKPFATFRFGYREFNGTDRTTWYDDVAVAPQRIGCLPKP